MHARGDRSSIRWQPAAETPGGNASHVNVSGVGRQSTASPAPMSGLAWGVMGVCIVTACKWTVTYGKTALFLVYHPDGDASPEGTEHGDDLPPDLFRWAGAGIQLGGLVGSVIFFVLTVPLKVIDN